MTVDESRRVDRRSSRGAEQSTQVVASVPATRRARFERKREPRLPKEPSAQRRSNCGFVNKAAPEALASGALRLLFLSSRSAGPFLCSLCFRIGYFRLPLRITLDAESSSIYFCVRNRAIVVAVPTFFCVTNRRRRAHQRGVPPSACVFSIPASQLAAIIIRLMN